jgi:hypothetical protein
MVVPGVIAVVSWWLATSGSCSGTGCINRTAGSWSAALVAAPTAPFVGLPWVGGPTRWLAAGVSSIVWWMVVGAWSARRAVRVPMATWRHYWREYRWLLLATALGSLGGLALTGALTLLVP